MVVNVENFAVNGTMTASDLFYSLQGLHTGYEIFKHGNSIFLIERFVSKMASCYIF